MQIIKCDREAIVANKFASKLLANDQRDLVISRDTVTANLNVQLVRMAYTVKRIFVLYGCITAMIFLIMLTTDDAVINITLIFAVKSTKPIEMSLSAPLTPQLGNSQ